MAIEDRVAATPLLGNLPELPASRLTIVASGAPR